ncbi:MAG TPA: hypothetical protein VN982_01650 [Candidatus Dormibacteraeota bacterium]|nr:hypothetical protein [Candidatus Dormibacteraeota bacterium]
MENKNMVGEEVEEIETEETWTDEYEKIWYTGFVLKYDDERYLFCRLDGTASDPRYRVFVHHSVVSPGLARVRVGARLKLRIRPNRKDTSSCPFEAVEAIVEVE